MTETQKPTRDRIVAFAESFVDPTQPMPDEPPPIDGYTAIVTDVREEADPTAADKDGKHDGTMREVVDLVVFYPGMAGIAVRGVPRDDTGETAGTWRFRPRA